MGINDTLLKQAGTQAGALAGAKALASLALVLMLQDTPRYDPMLEACQVIVQYAAWIWDDRVGMAELQRVWSTVYARQMGTPN